MKDKLNISLIILSGFLTLLVFHFFLKDITDYKLEITDIVKWPNETSRFYRDLNYDGYSEIIITGKQKESMKEFVSILNNSGKLLDQYNFSGNLIHNGILFGDVSGDGTEELVLLYRNNDSLYYDVINYVIQKKLKDRQFLIAKPDSAKNEHWNLSLSRGSRIVDIDMSNKAEAVIGIKAGFALYPRGIYIIDLINGDILEKFESASPIAELLYEDLDNDNKEEIICYSYAPANQKELTRFNDHTSWLFVFNDHFEFEIPPMRYGKFPEGIIVSTFLVEGEGYFLINYNNETSLAEPTSLMILNSKGRMIKEKKFPFEQFNDILVTNETGTIYLYLTLKGGEILKLNHHLEVVNSLDTNSKYVFIVDRTDINKDGYGEIICLTSNGLLITNNSLAKLLDEQIEDINIDESTFSLKYNGYDKNAEFSIKGDGKYYISKVGTNFFASYNYISAIILFFILSLTLISIKNDFINRFLVSKTYIERSNLLSEGIIVLDRNKRIISLNQTVENIFQTKIEKGDRLSSLVGLGELIENRIEANNNNKISEFELPLDFDSDENDYVRIKLLPVYLSKYYAGLTVILKLLKGDDYADKFKIWSRSVQKIAHDIKTPLSTVILNLQSLKYRIESSKIPEKEDYYKNLDRIHNEVERIKNLTKRFLKFIDLERPNIQKVQVNDVLDKSLKRFESIDTKKIKFDVDINKSNYSINADFNQLELVFHILIENSIDSIDEYGIIKIATDPIDEVMDKGRQYIQFEITDDGSGMEQDILEKIFQPNFTTKKDGTGLGLTMTKKIIEDHNGSISVFSRKDFGTTVRFTIPKSA